MSKFWRTVGAAYKQYQISKNMNFENQIEFDRIKSLYRTGKERKNTELKEKIIPTTREGGHEFEDLITLALTKLGYEHVRKVGNGPDGGVDIRAEQTNSIGTKIKYCIECKHQPNSTIGRPIIQKIDSAARSENAMAIVITSGVFSTEAKDYAKKVNIDLIDGHRLKKILEGAGMNYGTTSVPSHTLPISSFTEFKKFVEEHFGARNIKYHRSMEYDPKEILLTPIYVTKYTINSVFSTTVGIIHSINKTDMLVTDIDGDYLQSEISKQITNSIDKLNEKPQEVPGFHISLPDEYLPEDKHRKIVAEHIQGINTKVVSYLGIMVFHIKKTVGRLCAIYPLNG